MRWSSSWSTTAAPTAAAKLLEELDDPRLVKETHAVNSGKGAAIRTAVGLATGDYVIICDADLEYTPSDIPALLRTRPAG